MSSVPEFVKPPVTDQTTTRSTTAATPPPTNTVSVAKHCSGPVLVKVSKNQRPWCARFQSVSLPSQNLNLKTEFGISSSGSWCSLPWKRGLSPHAGFFSGSTEECSCLSTQYYKQSGGHPWLFPFKPLLSKSSFIPHIMFLKVFYSAFFFNFLQHVLLSISA